MPQTQLLVKLRPQIGEQCQPGRPRPSNAPLVPIIYILANTFQGQKEDAYPGPVSRKDENYNLKRYMHPYVHSSTIYNSQDTEAT